MNEKNFAREEEQIRINNLRRDAFRGCLVGGAIGDALGYPVEKAAKLAMTTVVDFLKEHPKAGLQVTVAAFDDRTMKVYQKALDSIQN